MEDLTKTIIEMATTYGGKILLAIVVLIVGRIIIGRGGGFHHEKSEGDASAVSEEMRRDIFVRMAVFENASLPECRSGGFQGVLYLA